MILTAFGVVSAATMVLAYSLESRGSIWIAVFSVACLTTAVYGAVSGAWLFAVLEVIWAGIAMKRFQATQPAG